MLPFGDRRFPIPGILIAFLSVISLSPVRAQLKPGSFGLTADLSTGFQGPSEIRTLAGPLHAGVAYSLNEKTSVRATIGFRTHADTSGNSESEFSVGGDLWYYLTDADQMSTFAGGGFAFGSASQPSGATTSVIGLRGFFGAEYWFSRRFAWHVHTGLDVVLSSLSGKSSSDLFLAASTGLTWYL